VLYDAGAADESEPFPTRIVFTGWFDTGKQGQEWPGEFEIVAHQKPLKWKAARSVQDRLVVSLRGSRPVSDRGVQLRFRYRLAGADEFGVGGVVVKAKRDEWQEMRLTLPGGVREIDALQFTVKAPGVLLVDDVLLYEP
jgi:hypothetical protein